MKMKKYFLLLLLSIYFIGLSNAQLSLGLKSGITNSWQEYGNDQERTSFIGLHAYLLSSYKLTDYFQVNADLGFIQRGGQDNIPLSPILSIGGYQYYLDYIDLPISIQANLPIIKNKLNLFTKAGYGLSYMANAQGVLLGLAFEENEKQQLDYDFLNRIDHGINLGVGINYCFSKSIFTLGIDYYHGLNNTIKNQTSKNRNLNINLAYQYIL